MTIKSRIVSILCGALFASAWFIVLDGISISNMIRDGNPKLLIKPNFDQPRFYWYYLVPCMLASFFVVLLNMVSIRQLYSDDYNYAGATKVKLWVFCMASGLTICFGSTIWINAMNFKDAYNSWPGISLMLNLLFQVISGILYFGAR